MMIALHLFGFVVVWLGVVLNLTAMLSKAADLYRGTLMGTDLEYALLNIVVVPAAAFIGFGYAYALVWKSYRTHVTKECMKCKCKSCAKS